MEFLSEILALCFFFLPPSEMSTPAEMRAECDKTVAKFNEVLATFNQAIVAISEVRDALVAATALEVEKLACEANPGRETFIRVMAIREEMKPLSDKIHNVNPLLFVGAGMISRALDDK